MEENTGQLLPELYVDADASTKLKETARWTRFLSIVGIIGIGLTALCLLLAGSYLIQLYSQLLPGIENYAGAVIFAMFIVLAIAGFMVFLLFRFSSLTKKGIETQDQELFNKGLRALQIYFTIWGVFAILGLLSNLRDLLHF